MNPESFIDGCSALLCFKGPDMGHKTQHVISLSSCVCVAGVAQVLNRLDGKPFDDADQRLFEV